MKKNKIAAIVAATVAAASCPAVAGNVVVSGLVDLYAGSVKYSGDSARRKVVNNGGMSTSWFGVSGQEDLGNGLRAEFALNGFFLGDTGASGRFTGDNLFSRNAYVGISGRFGRLSIGRNSAPSFLPAVLFNPFGDSFAFSPLILHTYVGTGPVGARAWAATTAGDSGWSNLVQYASPVVSGFQGSLYYQPGEQTAGPRPKNYGANLFYNNGPLGLTAAYTNVGVGNPNPGGPILDGTTSVVNYASITRQTGYFVGARYSFKPAMLYATARSNRNDAQLGKRMDDRTYTVGLSAPAGPGVVLAGYALSERSGSLVVTDRSRRTASLGYDVPMSPRTDVYGILMSDRISGAERANSAAAGIRHRF